MGVVAGSNGAWLANTGFLDPDSVSGTALSSPDPLVVKTREDHLADVTQYAIPAALLGAVETMGQSLNILEDDESLTPLVEKSFPQFTDWYLKNKEGAQLAGEFGTMIIPATIFMKALKAGKYANGAIKSIGRIKEGSRTGKALDGLFETNKVQQRAEEKYRQAVLLKSTRGLTDFKNDPEMADLFKKSRRLSVAVNVRETVAAELGIYTFFNDSQNFYPDEMSSAENLGWMAGFAGVSGVAARWTAGRTLRGITQSYAKAVNEMVTGGISEASDAASGVGNRGWAIVVESSILNGKRAEQKIAETVEERENIGRIIAAGEKQLEERIAQLGSDKPLMFGDMAITTKLDDDQILAVINNTQRDPGALHGAQSLQPLPKGGIDQFNKEKSDSLTKLRAEHKKLLEDHKFDPASFDVMEEEFSTELTRINKSILDHDRLEMYSIEANGEMYSLKLRRDIWQDQPGGKRNIKFESGVDEESGVYHAKTLTDEGTQSSIVMGADVQSLSILVRRSGAEFEGVNRANRETLDRNHRTLGYGLLQEVVDKWRPGQVLDPIGEGAHHTTLDAWIYGSEKHGQKWVDAVKLPDGWTKTDAEWNSLSGKFLEIMRESKAQALIEDAALTLPELAKLTSVDYLRMWNLPMGIRGEGSLVLETFRAFLLQGDIDLKRAAGTMESFKKAMTKTAQDKQGIIRQIDDQILESAEQLQQLPVTGEMFYLKPGQKPVGLLRSGDALNTLVTRERMVQGMALQRGLVNNGFAKASQDPESIVGALGEVMGEQQPAFLSSKDMTSMIMGGEAGGFLATTFKQFGEIEAMQNLYRIKDFMGKRVNRRLKIAYEDDTKVFLGQEGISYGDAFARLGARHNRASNVNYNTAYHAGRQGWDLAEGAREVISADGKSRVKKLVLAKTDKNRAMFEERFGDSTGLDFNKDEIYLPVGTGESYQHVVLDELAFAGWEHMDRMMRLMFKDDARLRQMMGLTAREEKPWMILPKDFGKGTNVFLTNDSGRLIQVVNGRTESAALASARRQAELLQSENGIRATVHTERTSAQYAELMEDSWFNHTDLQGPAKQRTDKAKSVGPVIDFGAEPLNEQLNMVQRGFESIYRRSSALLYDPQIQYARKLAMTSSSAEMQKQGRTIFNEYARTAVGDPILNPNEPIGKTYNFLEGMYDNIIAVNMDRAAGLVAKNNPWKQTTDELYQSLENQLGEFNPFTDAIELGAKTANVPIPSSLRTAGPKLNKFTSLFVLRFLDAGHAVLTLSSLMVTAPPVIRALAMSAVEAGEGELGLRKWRNRIAAIGSVTSPGQATFSPIKATVSAFHWMQTPEGRQILREAASEGLLDPTLTEIQSVLSSPHDGWIDRIIKKSTLAKMTVGLADGSEKWARIISFSMGHVIAERGHGLKGAHARMMAHDFANKVIGDYNPLNKPKIFQGAVGTPLSLFMTFTTNYLQRMFNYVEEGQKRALMSQIGLQAFFFGGSTVPGFNEFTQYFTGNYDGSINPIDALERKYGSEFTEWLMYGTLSNLPKMFGADDGIALYTRGDVSFRAIPTIFNIEDSPNFATFKAAGGAISEVISMFSQREGFSAQQMAEIVGNYSINRPIRNMAEMLAGSATDKGGLVTNANIYDEMSVVARALSMRPLSEEVKAEKLRSMQSITRSRNYKMAELRKVVRSDVRAGRYDSPDEADEAVNEMVGNYLKFGGNPENFGRFLSEQYVAATTNKADREVLSALTGPNGTEVLRMLPLFTDTLESGEFMRPLAPGAGVFNPG